jgi:chromosome segregation ATPase
VTYQLQDPGSTEHDPLWSRSPSECTNTPVPVSLSASQSRKAKQNKHTQVQSSNSQNLEDALIILNQKSEEIEVLESRLSAQEAQIEHLQAENYRIQVECEKLSVAHGVQREALEEAKGTVSELGIHIDWLQDSLDKSDAKVRQLQGKIDEIREVSNAKVEEHSLARLEWEEERTALEARLASSGDVPPQQPPTDWELEKQELEDKLAEVMGERDQLDKSKKYTEDEVESWKEQYRKEFMHSQELRQEAKDAKTENSRIKEEKAIVASQTTEAVRLITMKYEAVVEKLKAELGKAESLFKVLQVKDEQTGDDVRRRAMSAVHLQDEVRRLREELVSEVARKAARAAEVKRGKPSYLVDNFSTKRSMKGKYACQFLVNGVRCDQGFDSPQVL